MTWRQYTSGVSAQPVSTKIAKVLGYVEAVGSASAVEIGRALELTNGELRRALDLLERHGSLVRVKRRWTLGSGEFPDVAEPTAMSSIEHRLCASIEMLRSDIDRAIAGKLRVTIDFETSGLDTRWYGARMALQVAGFAYRYEGICPTYVPVGHRSRGRDANLDYELAAAELARLLRAAIPVPASNDWRLRPLSYEHAGDHLQIVVHNARFDLDVAEHFCGVSLTHPDSFVDTMIRHHLLFPSRPHGLKAAARDLLEHKGRAFAMDKLGALDYWQPNAQDTADDLGEYDEEAYTRIRSCHDFTLVDPTDPTALGYVAADVEATHRLADKLDLLANARRNRRGVWCDSDGQTNQDLTLERIDKRLVAALRRMERWRIQVDLPEVSRLIKEFDAAVYDSGGALERAQAVAAELGHPDLNPNSGQQLAKVLYETLGLKPPKRVKAKRERIDREVSCDGECSVETAERRLCKCSRAPSTDKEALRKLLAPCQDTSEFEAREKARPLLMHVLEFKKLTKVINTYLNKLACADEDSTVRASFSAFKSSARFSAPSRGIPGGAPVHGFPKGKKSEIPLRHLFVARDGFEFVVVDFRAQEMRIVAALSGEPYWIDSFARGVDPHADMANELFGAMPEPKSDDPAHKVWEDRRDLAKALLFSIIYGASDDTVEARVVADAARLGLDASRAATIRTRLLERVPTFAAWDAQNRRDMQTRGYVRTGFGRRLSSRKGHAGIQPHPATNFRVQGTGADLMRRAMVLFHERAEVAGWNTTGDVKMLLTVHDELVLEIRLGLADQVVPILHDCMLQPAAALCAKAPLTLDTTRGRTWAASEKYIARNQSIY